MLNINVEIISLEDYSLSQLEREWRTLFDQSEATFFLSWNWIGSWLSILPTLNNCRLVRATKANDNSTHSIVGLGIFYETVIWRHGFVRSRQWHLHRTGDPKLDQIWIEYNDFLISKFCDEKLRKLIWQAILNSNSFDEIFVELCPPKSVNPHFFVQNTHKLKFNFQTEIGYRLNYRHLTNPSEYTKNISLSTFKNIRRTKTLLSKDFALRLEVVCEKEKIITNLFEFNDWHIEKWQNTSTPSGFSNSMFCKFHKRLINSNDVKNSALIFKLEFGTETIAILYGFASKNDFYFYLMSKKSIKDNKIKVGLLMHQLVVEYFAKKDFKSYDLLAGHEDYKTKMSNEKIEFVNCIIQRKKLFFSLESYLKMVKSKITI